MNLWPSTLRAALTSGLAAGVVAAAFSFVVVEPTVRLALAVEESRTAMEHTHGESGHDTELVSRGLQQIGGALAVIVAALLLSLLYAVALSRFRRTSNFSELASALVVAGGASRSSHSRPASSTRPTRPLSATRTRSPSARSSTRARSPSRL